MKRKRQAIITEKVREGSIKSQRELMEILASEGFKVSQTTVSRDMKELGLVKVRKKNGIIAYAEPGGITDSAKSDRALERLAPQVLLDAETAYNLVVVKTSPGNAQGLAWAIDSAGIEGIAGTVAGDDTIIVVCSEGVNSKEIKNVLLRYAEPER